MILTQIEITNYKQYGGHHLIEIPQSGAIGVIGANGALTDFGGGLPTKKWLLELEGIATPSFV